MEQQTEMARNSGRTLAALHPEQVRPSYTVLQYTVRPSYKVLQYTVRPIYTDLNKTVRQSYKDLKLK